MRVHECAILCVWMNVSVCMRASVYRHTSERESALATTQVWLCAKECKRVYETVLVECLWVWVHSSVRACGCKSARMWVYEGESTCKCECAQVWVRAERVSARKCECMPWGGAFVQLCVLVQMCMGVCLCACIRAQFVCMCANLLWTA